MAVTVMVEDFHKSWKERCELWRQGKAQGQGGAEEHLPGGGETKWTEKG